MIVVRFAPELVVDLAEHVRGDENERPRRERMGFLFGYRMRGIRMVTAYAPYKGGYRGPWYVEYEPEKIRDRVEYIEEKTGKTFLGIYHSHPLRSYEKIPEDLLEMSEQSEVDRLTFLENRWNPMSLIIGVGRGRQARKHFMVSTSKAWFIRRRRGYLQVLCSSNCHRLWVIQGRLSWFFLFNGYTRGRQGKPEPVVFDLDPSAKSEGLITTS